MRTLLIALVALAALAAQNAFAQCCGTATDGSSCKTLGLTPASVYICIDDGIGDCAGGNALPHSSPGGCKCVGGACSGWGNDLSAQECTHAAAASCCAAGQGNNCPALSPPPTVVPLPTTCRLPATGVTTASVRGDDGDVRAGAALSYTDNLDGTITDNNTGLMWEKKIERDGVQNAAEFHDADNCYPWRGLCSGDGAECGTDADCPSGQTCDALDCQTAFPNGLTIFKWVAALNAQSFAGHEDWRIPNEKELESIMDYAQGGPAVPLAFNDRSSCGATCTDLRNPACSCTQVGPYWSGTTAASDAARAWAVGSAAGAMGLDTKVLSVLDLQATCGSSLTLVGCKPVGDFVRAVRGESCGFPATGANRMVVRGEDGNPLFGTLSYTDNLDGTITDNNTGLMWEKKIEVDEVPNAANLHDADNCYPWQGVCSANGAECGTDADCSSGQTCDAVDCQGSGMTIFKWTAALNAANLAGHSDWRVPNVKELVSIVNYGAFNPAVSPAFSSPSCGAACSDLTSPACSCTKSAPYWSGTSNTDNDSQAWSTLFTDGSLPPGNNPKTLDSFIRAVRGGS